MIHLVPKDTTDAASISFVDICIAASETGEPLGISWTDATGYGCRAVGRAAGLFRSQRGEEFVFLQQLDGYRGVPIHRISRIERIGSRAQGVIAISKDWAWA